MEGDLELDREGTLQTVRERFKAPICALLGELEKQTLSKFAQVPHIQMNDNRAVGSVLNSALPKAAEKAGIKEYGLEVEYVHNGNSNKISGSIDIDGCVYPISFELHLSNYNGKTSKSSHQFAGYDFELEPTFPGMDTEAPSKLLFFIACHLDCVVPRIACSYLRFADRGDQRMCRIEREAPTHAVGIVADDREAPASVTGAVVGDQLKGPKEPGLKTKKQRGKQDQHGSKADKRRNAASGS